VRYFVWRLRLSFACGGKEASPSNGLDLAVVGQTITKVRHHG